MKSGWSTIRLSLRKVLADLTTLLPGHCASYGMGTHGVTRVQHDLKLHRNHLIVNKGNANTPTRRLMKKPLGQTLLASKRRYAKLVIAQFPVAGAVPNAPHPNNRRPASVDFSQGGVSYA